MTRACAGTIAVVVGASRGIGRCIAEAFTDRGMVVAPVARSGVRFRADISNPADVDRIKLEIEAELGTPTVLVNAAGVYGPLAPIRDADPDEWIRTLLVDTVGPYLTCHAFVSGMLEAGWGRIVNVSSAASLGTPGPRSSAYSTAKAALNRFTRHLAAELRGSGVTANVIHPGEVKTDMWADIRHKTIALEGSEAGRAGWVGWVEETGGDPPEKAANLVLDIIDGDVNGRFLWIAGGLKGPLPSWE